MDEFQGCALYTFVQLIIDKIIFDPKHNCFLICVDYGFTFSPMRSCNVMTPLAYGFKSMLLINIINNVRLCYGKAPYFTMNKDAWLEYLKENMYVDEISQKFVHLNPIANNPVLLKVMVWRWTGKTPLPEPLMTRCNAYIWVSMRLAAWLFLNHSNRPNSRYWST